MEILFAIFVLGIGFIMIAAIFPVAINQTQTAAEVSTGRAVAEGAMVQLEYFFQKYKSPPLDSGDKFRGLSAVPTLHAAINGSRIVAADRRFAWIPIYKYDAVNNRAEVYVIAVQVRNKSAYDDDDLPGLTPITGQARLTVGGATGNDRVWIDPDTNAGRAAAEGAYIIRVDGRGPVRRIGSAVNQANGDWELIPDASAPLSTADDGATVDILIVGRGLDDYTQGHQGGSNYTGGAQDAYIIGPHGFTP